MGEYLIIDGYNIINDWPELKKLKDDNLEYARAKLIEIMSSHAALTGQKTTIVFDAYLVKKGRGSNELVQGIQVIFTKEGVTADMAIERLTAQLPKHQKVFVATSDRLQQETIWGKGAFRISARELYLEVNQIRQEHQKHYTPPLYTSNRLEDRIAPEVKAILDKIRLSKSD